MDPIRWQMTFPQKPVSHPLYTNGALLAYIFHPLSQKPAGVMSTNQWINQRNAPLVTPQSTHRQELFRTHPHLTSAAGNGVRHHTSPHSEAQGPQSHNITHTPKQANYTYSITPHNADSAEFPYDRTLR